MTDARHGRRRLTCAARRSIFGPIMPKPLSSQVLQRRALAALPTRRFLRAGAVVAAFAILALSVQASRLAGQQPTAAEVQQRLQEDVGLAELVRQRISQSGLTESQIRTQLQALGYPTTLLDQYLQADTELTAEPGSDVLRALALLGLGGVSTTIQGDSTLVTALDSVVRDSLRADSLGLFDSVPALPVFGLSVFRRVSSEFQPSLAGPVDERYRLGPGDVLVLILTGHVELAHTLEVNREGFVVIPQVGQLFVNTLTLDQLRTLLFDRLGQVYSGIRRGPTATTSFEVTVARVRTVQVYVVGEVTRPGSYQIPAVGTALTALYEAGGPTELGNFRNVEIRRSDRAVARLDLYDYLLRGVAEQDTRLETGDVVFVPILDKRVRIDGAVRRSAIFGLRTDETLRDLVEIAGGLRPDAVLQRLTISRIVPAAQRRANDPARMVVDVPLQPDGSVPPFPMERGDQVRVWEITHSFGRYVELNGSVQHPGVYGWRRGMRLSQLIEVAGGFRPAVYAGRAHIERLHPTDSTRYIVPVQLPADSLAPYPDDLTLQEYDIVTVYGRDEFREERMVRIAGMVNNPGRFPYRAGMTLRDLVLMARGLRDGAYLDTAEVARLPADRSGGQLAFTLRVAMDSTYLFERDSTTYRFLPGLSTRASGAPEFALEPFDEISILRQPDFGFQRTITISGEVRFPGTYALTQKGERLGNLVRRAGGLLPTAYADGVRFFRKLDDAGRVNIDLRRALEQPGSLSDVILQPEDSVDIPEYDPTVRVAGAVNAPTSVLYNRGRGLKYYIGNAGGYSPAADKNRVSVRYADGSARVKNRFLFFTSAPAPGPGSTIFVPTRDPERESNIPALFGSIAQILASTVAIVAIATR